MNGRSHHPSESDSISSVNCTSDWKISSATKPAVSKPAVSKPASADNSVLVIGILLVLLSIGTYLYPDTSRLHLPNTIEDVENYKALKSSMREASEKEKDEKTKEKEKDHEKDENELINTEQ